MSTIGNNEKASGFSNANRSWAQVLSRNIQGKSNNKNVIEVILEKDERGPFRVTHEECFKLMRKVGIDTRPGIHVEEIQICPNGRGVLYITLKESVDISRYCRYDVIEVSESGIRSVLVKPAGKRDVIINSKHKR